MTAGEWAMLAYLALFASSVFLVRWRILRRIRSLMMTRMSETGAEGPPSLSHVETQAGTGPRLVIFDAANPAPGAVEARERFVAAARSLYGEILKAGMITAGAYFALPLAAGFVSGNSEAGTGFGIIFGGGWAIASGTRHFLFRKQFRPADNQFKLTVSKLHPGMWGLRAVLAPRMQIAFIVFYVLLAGGMGIEGLTGGEFEGGQTFRVVGGALVAAVGVHLWLAWELYRKGQRAGGVRLLVLRVFGIDANAKFTFGRLLRFWRHFGPYFTIVDPVFWRHQNRVFSLGTLWFLAGMFFLSLLVVIPLESRVSEDGLLVCFAVSFAACLSGYVFANEYRLRREFVRGREHLAKILGRLGRRPRNLDQSFRPLAALCYDDTWKPTVEEFTNISDVVLMDLRGFSHERKGCEWEVDYLFDHVPVERIVILVNDAADLGLTRLLIEDRWRLLRRSSPNLGLVNPEVKVYISRSQDEHDVQGILDLLMLAASQERRCARAAVS